MNLKFNIPRKRFGQNFLQDQTVIQNIITAIDPKPADLLVEIGPGRGALTFPLLEIADHLQVIELDRDLAAILTQSVEPAEKLTVYSEDALKFDFTRLCQRSDQKMRIIGNLPYNISTPLLFHLLKFAPIIEDMHFMLQKEVVDRLTAHPNSKEYGRLSIMIQYQCEVTYLLTVPPSAFKPQPKVQSAVVQLKPYSTPPFPCKDLALLKSVTTTAFNQRRKTLSNALKPYLKAEDFLTLDLDPKGRAEELSVAEFVRITNFIAGKSS